MTTIIMITKVIKSVIMQGSSATGTLVKEVCVVLHSAGHRMGSASRPFRHCAAFEAALQPLAWAHDASRGSVAFAQIVHAG